MRRRFATTGTGGIDLAAVMLFFGRDIFGQPQQPTVSSGFSDQPEGVVASSGQEEEEERRREETLRQAQEEEERSAAEVEVRHTDTGVFENNTVRTLITAFTL